MSIDDRTTPLSLIMESIATGGVGVQSCSSTASGKGVHISCILHVFLLDETLAPTSILNRRHTAKSVSIFTPWS